MMKRLRHSIIQGLSQWRIALVVYVIQLLLAMTLGMQLYQVFEASIGDSLELNKLIEAYDHTVVSDLLNVHGGSIAPILGQLRWVILAYLVFSVFMNAGLLYTVFHQSNNWKDFWRGGAEYFFRFFKITLFFLLIYLIISVIIGVGVAMVFGNMLEFSSEVKGFIWLAVFAIILIISFIKIFTASTYSKLSIMNGGSVWKSFVNGWRTLRQRWMHSWGILIPLIAIQVLLYILYLWSEANSGMTSLAFILIFFIIQQGMIFFRSIWKLMMYNGLFDVFQDQNK